MKLPSAAATLLSLFTLAHAQNSTSPCSPSVHMIVARASFEPAGYGILASVVRNISTLLNSTTSTAVPYPATFVDPPYVDSEQQGVGNMTALIRSYVDACPSTPLALLGYSQGAQVALDTVLGTDEPAFSDDIVTQGLAPRYVAQIAAVVVMGDPSRVAGAAYDVGNATGQSVFPRSNGARVQELGLGGRLRSYCDANDTYCDSGSSSLVHASYVMRYGADAAAFVVDKVREWNAANGTGTGTTTAGNGTTAGEGGGVAAAESPATADAPAMRSMRYWMTGVLGSALVVALCL
jgi:acetylxylan esterase